MTTQVQRRRGTSAQHASFTGAAGEITVDTTNNRVVVHDGSTAGGHAAAKISEVVLTSALAAGMAAWFASPTSVNLKAAITDETGSGALVFADSPTLVTPALGAASATTISVGGNQVVGARVTGWGAPSGTLDRTILAAYAGQTVSAGYVQAEAQTTDDAVKKVSQELAALITDLRAHGLIGT